MNKYYFPFLPKNGRPDSEEDAIVGLGIVPPPRAEPNYESIFIDLMMNHPDQKRRRVMVNGELTAAAMYKAHRLLEVMVYDHVVDGIGPNQLARDFGYAIPSWYHRGIQENNIESLTRGQPTTIRAFDNLLTSPKHRMHILGLHEFYKGQEHIGIGYAHVDYNPPGWTDMWCIMTAH